MSGLISAVTRTGSIDGASSFDDLDDDEPLDVTVDGQSDKAEALANDAFAQLEHRQQLLGPAYPFTISTIGTTLRMTSRAPSSPYAFLLVLTHAQNKTRDDGPSLFEQVSRSALVEYLGGQTRVEFYDFGSPRRNASRAFRAAVKDLCIHMGEGRDVKPHARMARVQDAGVDVVAWVPFRDGRSNQLTVLGQCTTSNRWRNKMDELQPHDFCQRWLAEQPAMSPLAAFFVPHHISDDEWRHVAVGERRLLFDRLRVARLLTDLDSGLGERCAEWTLAALGGGG